MKTKHPVLSNTFKSRFRNFLPVVVDIETSGVNFAKNAILEICIVFIDMDENGLCHKGQTFFEHVLPFPKAVLDKKSLEFNKIDPYQPLRFALDEKEALKNLYDRINKKLKETGCTRAVLVGHNAWFDLLFVKEASHRTGLKMPFHAFTCLDTATLGGLFYGQTVLAKAMEMAGIDFDAEQAHSAIYDAEKTAELFCKMINEFRALHNLM